MIFNTEILYFLCRLYTLPTLRCTIALLLRMAVENAVKVKKHSHRNLKH